MSVPSTHRSSKVSSTPRPCEHNRIVLFNFYCSFLMFTGQGAVRIVWRTGATCERAGGFQLTTYAWSSPPDRLLLRSQASYASPKFGTNNRRPLQIFLYPQNRQASSLLTVWFDDFKTGIDPPSASSRKQDTLNVYDGFSNASALLGSFAGSSIPPSVTTSGKVLLLQLDATATSTVPVFEIRYETVGAESSCTMGAIFRCSGGAYQAASGILGHTRVSSDLSTSACRWQVNPLNRYEITGVKRE